MQKAPAFNFPAPHAMPMECTQPTTDVVLTPVVLREQTNDFLPIHASWNFWHG